MHAMFLQVRLPCAPPHVFLKGFAQDTDRIKCPWNVKQGGPSKIFHGRKHASFSMTLKSVICPRSASGDPREWLCELL